MAFDKAMDALADASVFAGLTEEQLKLLAFSSETRRFSPGAALCEAGDEAEGAFVLITGTLVIDPGQGEPFVVSDKGAMIGETALFSSQPRRATVKAVNGVQVVFVPRSGFRKLIEAYPDLAGRHSARLRDSLGRYMRALDTARRKLEGPNGGR